MIAQAIIDAQSVYLQERLCLLQSILALLMNPGTGDRSASAYIKDLLAKDLEANLLKSLNCNAALADTFLTFTCSMRDVNASI